MERTRKRDSNVKSLRASDKPKKSKPSDSSFMGFSNSTGDTSPNKDHLCQTDHQTISNGEDGRTGETKLDSSWDDKNCISMEDCSVGGGEALEGDQPTVFKKTSDNPQDLVTPDLLTGPNLPPMEPGCQKTPREGEPTTKTTKPQNQQRKSYTCVCGKSYTSSSHLHRHQKTHGGNTKTSSGYRIREPCEIKATSEKSFPCICGKSYTISSHLYRHQKTCQAGTPTNLESDAEESRLKPYSCACGKRYTSSSHLYRHQRSHLDGNNQSVKTYIFDCGKMFSSESDLSGHQKTQETFQIEHGGDSVEDTETEAPGRVKPYVCPCGKSYTSSSHLYRHQRTHQVDNISASSRSRATDNTMEKPYKCDCGKSYTSTSHLYRHQRTHKTQELLVDDLDCDSDVHMEDPGEKPYQCECGKSFILWFSLMVHKRIHCKAKLQASPAQDSS